MKKPNRITVKEFKSIPNYKGESWVDDTCNHFNGEISSIISYLQAIVEEGYTHMQTDTEYYSDYSGSYTKCETKYYRNRPETDEEYEKRCEDLRSWLARGNYRTF